MTYVYSPIEQDAGAQIEFYTYSRSGNEKGPKTGAWDRRGSKIWLNGAEIAAPVWEQPDANIQQNHATQGLTNENLTAREVVKVYLRSMALFIRQTNVLTMRPTNLLHVLMKLVIILILIIVII